jgi:hypothetical protein
MYICGRPHDDATVNVELHMEDLKILEKSKGRFAAAIVSRMLRRSRWRSLASTALALFTAFLEVKGEGAGSKAQGTKNGPNARQDNGGGRRIIVPEGFFDDYAAADGWDPERYSKIVKNGNSKHGKAGGH